MKPTIEHLVAAKIKREVAEKWLPHVQRALDEFNIVTPRAVAAWIAQTAHESGGYTLLEENLNYSAVTMAACWPPRFAVQEQDPDRPGKTRAKKDANGKNIPTPVALALAKHPQALANMVYSSRMGNGPPESNEGWLYRGRGLKQLTGKDNVTRCSKALGVDFVTNPDLLIEPEYAARSAAWFWSVNNCTSIIDGPSCTKETLTADYTALTKKINGGTIGLADRRSRYDAVIAVSFGEMVSA
jgi:putative chitinase